MKISHWVIFSLSFLTSLFSQITGSMILNSTLRRRFSLAKLLFRRALRAPRLLPDISQHVYIGKTIQLMAFTSVEICTLCTQTRIGFTSDKSALKDLKIIKLPGKTRISKNIIYLKSEKTWKCP